MKFSTAKLVSIGIVCNCDKVTVYIFGPWIRLACMRIFVVFPLVKANVEIGLNRAYRVNFR
jgi:hypothetical protein